MFLPQKTRRPFDSIHVTNGHRNISVPLGVLHYFIAGIKQFVWVEDISSAVKISGDKTEVHIHSPLEANITLWDSLLLKVPLRIVTG